MPLIHYEKYNYVLIACRYETDYNDLVRKLGIEGKKIKMAKKRKIKARAIWYEDVKAQIVAGLKSQLMTRKNLLINTMAVL